MCGTQIIVVSGEFSCQYRISDELMRVLTKWAAPPRSRGTNHSERAPHAFVSGSSIISKALTLPRNFKTGPLIATSLRPSLFLSSISFFVSSTMINHFTESADFSTSLIYIFLAIIIRFFSLLLYLNSHIYIHRQHRSCYYSSRSFTVHVIINRRKFTSRYTSTHLFPLILSEQKKSSREENTIAYAEEKVKWRLTDDTAMISFCIIKNNHRSDISIDI